MKDLTFAGLYVVLVVAACLPVWLPTYFFNGDGPSHLHSAAMMIDLAGEGGSSSFYTFNSALLPNSLGHWLLAGLMLFVSPVVASKAIVTVSYAGFVAAVAWLRFSVRGTNGLGISILIGAVLGFNWLWLAGLYNFVLGVIVFLIAVGFLYKWNGVLYGRRFLLLSIFLVAAYFSHMVSFGVLAMTAVIFVSLRSGSGRFRSLAWLAAALLPVVMLAIVNKMSMSAGGGISPGWYVLNEPPSFSSILLHLRTTDPFLIISRRFIPFWENSSSFNVLAAPVLWISLAFILLTIATLTRWRDLNFKGWLPHIVAMLAMLILAIAAPDGFGSEQGSVVRPRFLLCAAVLFVPLFVVRNKTLLRPIAAALLLGVFSYQTAALWEYSSKVNSETAEFLEAAGSIKNGERIASVMIFEGQPRFHPEPIRRMDNLFGITNNLVVWDNYETGYYFFPVIAVRDEDRRFIREFSELNTFRLQYAHDDVDRILTGLTALLSSDHGKIDTLLVWGRNAQVEGALHEWFEPEPYFEKGRVRLFRNRTRAAGMDERR